MIVANRAIRTYISVTNKHSVWGKCSGLRYSLPVNGMLHSWCFFPGSSSVESKWQMTRQPRSTTLREALSCIW